MDDYNTESKQGASSLQSPHFRSLVASGIPSIIMRPVYQPLELLKIRFQLQHANLTHEIHFNGVKKGEAYKSMLHAVQVIHAEEGWRAFFKGLGFAQVANTSSSVIQFALYRKLRKALHKTNLQDAKIWCDLLAGFITGATTAVILNPLDCIRTHLLARESSQGVFKIAFNIYKNGGLVSFYNGALTAIWHAGTLNGLRFMFYNIGCNYAMKYEGVESHKNLQPMELFIAGFGAGFVANIFSYPIEVVKRRLILDKARKLKEPTPNDAKNLCRAILQCIGNVVRTEGPMAIYKGFVPNAMKSIIATTIQLSCYDMIYHAIENWFT